MHQIPVHRALQVPRAILHVGAFAQQELLGIIAQGEHERRRIGRTEDTLLHHIQFDSEDLAQFRRPQRMEHHRLIDTVDELRGELAPGRFHARAIHLLRQRFVDDPGCL